METSPINPNNSLPQSVQKVTVFLRNYKKHALPFALASNLSSRALKQQISAKMQNSIKNLAIFYKGKLVEDSQTTIALQENGILHLVNLNRTMTPELNLTFRLHKDPDRMFKAKTSPIAIIREVLQHQLKPQIGKGQNEVFLVYVGKPLNIFKKFIEEYVEDESQIMVVQFKNRIHFEPRQAPHIEEINHTRVMLAASVASTKLNYAPALGTMNSSHQYSISKFKPNLGKQFQNKIEQAAPEEESASPFLKQKKEDNKIKIQRSAPGSDFSKYTGFDPHKQTAPGAEIQSKKVVIPHDPNFKEITNETAPPHHQMKGPIFKEEDFIFSGDAQLEELQNIIPDSIQQAKQNLLKKKQSSKEYH